MTILDKSCLSKIFFLFIIILTVNTCGEKTLGFSGKTMGTTYTIKVRDLPQSGKALDDIKKEVDAELERLESVFSTYRPQSEISRFNAIYRADTWHTISRDFFEVMQLGTAISQRSAGAFSTHLGRLVNLWGFGPRKVTEYPDESKARDYARCASALRIKFAQPVNGQNQKYRIEPVYDSDHNRRFCSQDKGLRPQIDLSAIAKGYAVDKVAQLLAQQEITNYMVEIGGEVCSRISDISASPWRIGLKNPAKPEQIANVVNLRTNCMATSGNSHQVLLHNNKQLTHILNPFTGMPLERNFSSVSVIADTNAQADAWATALYVMGKDQGIPFANNQKLAALYLSENNGKVVAEHSIEWKNLK